MEPIDAFTDFSTAALAGAENELSRRYLRLVLRWIPVGMRYFNPWPGRPNCGHFFGGVLWYGQDTCSPIATLALAASSPEYDAEVTNMPRDELRQVALQGLRYLCFTHDTGPEDCVRPSESWGRPEPAGTKWGERGKGFFRESQCGRTVLDLALTAALIQDLLTDEEREMLARIAEDYLGRFGAMAPKSGVYNDTQTEENAWTAEGLTASLLLLPGHPRRQQIWEQTKLWMFRTTTRPEDAHDPTEFADGKTVAQLCGRTYTTLPDGTGENHGFVHPSYMLSALSLGGATMALLRLYGQEPPPHLFWRRQDTYDLLKPWYDDTGAPHCVQGMDWPYFAYQGQAFIHATANLFLRDPDAALMERRTLEVLERSSTAHGGRVVPEDTVRHCHGQQDPALMRERLVCSLGLAYMAHRMLGVGQAPTASDDFEQRVSGVHVYPHGGAVLHRHAKGRNSLAWRNRTMALPATREGMRLVGPAAGSMLASVQVRGRAASTRQRALKIREDNDRVGAVLVQRLAEDAVERLVFFASLPSGKCLVVERLTAVQDIVVESLAQGRLNVINDGYFGDHEDLRGRRHIYWERGDRVLCGYPTDSDQNDMALDLGDTRWVNLDDRAGIVFEASGQALYHHRHYFKVWHAIEDELVLSRQGSERSFKAGEDVAQMTALWCPHQSHEETARQELRVHSPAAGIFAAEVDGLLCAANLSDVCVTFALPQGESAAVGPDCNVRLGPWEPAILDRPKARIDA